MEADQKRGRRQRRHHGGEIRCQHAHRKYRARKARGDRRRPQLPAVVAAADLRHHEAADQRARHAEQALEGAGIGADFGAGEMMYPRQERRDPGRRGVVGISSQAKPDQHDGEGALRGEEAERRPDRLRRKSLGHGAALRLGDRQP